MNRRDMILTTAAATVTASTSAAGNVLNGIVCSELAAPSPIVMAARRWREQYDWINDTDLTEKETDAAVSGLHQIEQDLLALEPAGDHELLVQLMITTTMWEGVGELYEGFGNTSLLRARCDAFKERVL